MNIDSIIAEWTYRLEKGYPDCPEDYIELRNVLHEQTDLPIEEQDAIVRRAMGLTEDMNPINLQSKESSNFAELLKKIPSLTQLEQIEELAKYTKDYTSLGKIISETTFNVDFGEYSEDNEKYQLSNLQDNQGNTPIFDINANFNKVIIEQLALNEVAKRMNANNASWYPGQEQGADGRINEFEFEIKGSDKQKPNLMFQTSFPTADTDTRQKYYIFIYHNGSNQRRNLKFYSVNVVSSDLLRKVLYGEKIYNEFKNFDASETLVQQIENGLSGFNFKDQIISALTTGDTSGYQRQFRIGNNVNIRFLIFIEPKKFGSASDGINENEGYEI